MKRTPPSQDIYGAPPANPSRDVFDVRFTQFRLFFGLQNVDLSHILGKSPEAIRCYQLPDDDENRRRPVFADLQEYPIRLGASLEFFFDQTGQVGMFSDAVRSGFHRVYVAAADVVAEDPHQRMVALIEAIQREVPQSSMPWWIAGLCGFGKEDGAAAAVERFEAFVSGRTITQSALSVVLERLTTVTGIPDMWIQLGDAKWLTPPGRESIGPWINVYDRSTRYGHKPEQYLRHMDQIDAIIRQYERVIK